MFGIFFGLAVAIVTVHVTPFSDSPTHGFMVGTDSAYCTVQTDTDAPGAGIYCQFGN